MAAKLLLVLLFLTAVLVFEGSDPEMNKAVSQPRHIVIK